MFFLDILESKMLSPCWTVNESSVGIFAALGCFVSESATGAVPPLQEKAFHEGNNESIYDTVDGWNLAPPGMYETL